MADNVNNVTDSTFQAEVIDASNTQPVMVDFWAEWCRPCLMLAPTVAEIHELRRQVQHPRHPDAAHFQGRTGGRAGGRRGAA